MKWETPAFLQSSPPGKALPEVYYIGHRTTMGFSMGVVSYVLDGEAAPCIAARFLWASVEKRLVKTMPARMMAYSDRVIHHSGISGREILTTFNRLFTRKTQDQAVVVMKQPLMKEAEFHNSFGTCSRA